MCSWPLTCKTRLSFLSNQRGYHYCLIPYASFLVVPPAMFPVFVYLQPLFSFEGYFRVLRTIFWHRPWPFFPRTQQSFLGLRGTFATRSEPFFPLLSSSPYGPFREKGGVRRNRKKNFFSSLLFSRRCIGRFRTCVCPCDMRLWEHIGI